ncbi:MAG: hypothetical protein DRN53_05930 [Thermoprotei archaeon]|nr:MAG: hypothetical protein DRN53_05930 [Thermoprotei archaeon]
MLKLSLDKIRLECDALSSIITIYMLQSVMRPFIHRHFFSDILGYPINIFEIYEFLKINNNAQKIFSSYLEVLEAHAKLAEENPRRTKKVAENFLRKLHPYWRIALELDVEFVQRITRKCKCEHLERLINMLAIILWKSMRYVREEKPRFAEALEIFLEDAITRLLWLVRDPERYRREIHGFLREYEDEAYEYAILHASSLLLLKVLSKNIPLWLIQGKYMVKQRVLINKLIEIAEEIEPYVATFQLMKDPLKKEDLEIVKRITYEDELGRFLER